MASTIMEYEITHESRLPTNPYVTRELLPTE